MGSHTSRIWYWLVDETEGSASPYPSSSAAKAGLERILQRHTYKGKKVREELENGKEGDNPLWIVEHKGEIIAKYRLIENT